MGRRSSSPVTSHLPTTIYTKPYASVTSLPPLDHALEPSLEPFLSSTPKCQDPSAPVFVQGIHVAFERPYSALQGADADGTGSAAANGGKTCQRHVRARRASQEAGRAQRAGISVGQEEPRTGHGTKFTAKGADGGEEAGAVFGVSNLSR